MYEHLKNIGVKNVEEITRYTLRQEANNDILKIYFKKSKSDFLAKSIKFKFQRQSKKVVRESGTKSFTNISEISSTLRHIIEELDSLSIQVNSEKEVKKQILDDLKHLESVVASKISEIEKKLEKL